MKFLATILACFVGLRAMAWTHSKGIWYVDGSQAEISYAMAHLSPWETIELPAGNFVLGTGGFQIYNSIPYKFRGAGTNATFIQLADNASLFGVAAPALIDHFTISKSTNAPSSPFWVGEIPYFRISDVWINDSTQDGYLIEVEKGRGLIDNCVLVGASGGHESIFFRGPTNAWVVADGVGTTNLLTIENCYYAGPQYCEEADCNSSCLFRFNLMMGENQVDNHMIDTSSTGDSYDTHHGSRSFECYGNIWGADVKYWALSDFTSGTGYCFNNVATNTPWMQLYIYGALLSPPYWTNIFYNVPYWTNLYWTEIHSNPPKADFFVTPYYQRYAGCIPDQPGTGTYPQSRGQSPWFFFNNVQNLSGNGAGPAGVDMAMTWKGIPANAEAQYTNEMHDVNASYWMGGTEDTLGTNNTSLIANLDYYKGTYGSTFTGTNYNGVGIGSKAAMLAITPTINGVGYWVTNEANWNATVPANTSGQMYRWDGVTNHQWYLYYTPLSYPHPLTQTLVDTVLTTNPPVYLPFFK